VQALGTGITLDSPLARTHAIHAVVLDAAVKTAGYQGAPEPNQWFGGPELASNVPFFERIVSRREGSMILRDASGVVVDSLNYGGVVDPWAAEGYQGVSGAEQSGCHVIAPGVAGGFNPMATANASDASAGRFPDGSDTDSNCNDFQTTPSTTLAAASATGTTNIKLASVAGFDAGQTIRLDAGANVESAVIATVGTAGATTVRTATDTGATTISVTGAMGFTNGQTITIDSGDNAETAVVASITRFGGTAITVESALAHAHAIGAQVSGTGITLTSALSRTHATSAQVVGSASTPGAPNRYQKQSNEHRP
jgi:hypothetical protein